MTTQASFILKALIAFSVKNMVRCSVLLIVFFVSPAYSETMLSAMVSIENKSPYTIYFEGADSITPREPFRIEPPLAKGAAFAPGDSKHVKASISDESAALVLHFRLKGDDDNDRCNLFIDPYFPGYPNLAFAAVGYGYFTSAGCTLQVIDNTPGQYSVKFIMGGH